MKILIFLATLCLVGGVISASVDFDIYNASQLVFQILKMYFLRLSSFSTYDLYNFMDSLVDQKGQYIADGIFADEEAVRQIIEILTKNLDQAFEDQRKKHVEFSPVQFDLLKENINEVDDVSYLVGYSGISYDIVTLLKKKALYGEAMKNLADTAHNVVNSIDSIVNMVQKYTDLVH